MKPATLPTGRAQRRQQARFEKKARQPAWQRAQAQSRRDTRPPSKKCLTELGISNWGLLTQLTSAGAADVDLWNWLGSLLMYTHMAERVEDAALHAGLAAAVEATMTVVTRFKRLGRVGFSGPELTACREAVQWMEALAEVTPNAIAIECGTRAERELERIRAGLPPR